MKTKMQITLGTLIGLILAFPVLVWRMGWTTAVVVLSLGVSILAVIHWIEPVKKLMGKIRGRFKRTPTPPTAPPPDIGDYGSQLSKTRSILACLAGITLVLVLVSSLLLYLLGSWSIGFPIGNTTYTVSWIPLLLVLAVLYIAVSFQQVGETENAVKVAFGYMFEDVGPGLTFVPRWACKLVRVTSNVITLAGGTPEKVKAAERGESLGVAAGDDKFIQAILVQSDNELLGTSGTIRVSEEATRVTFAEKPTALYFSNADKTTFGVSKNPLSLQFTADPKIVMGLLIPKEGIRMLIRRFGSPFRALREIDELMTSHLQLLCGRITTEYFVYRVDDVGLMLQLVLEKLLGDTNEITGGKTKPEACLVALGLRIEAIQSLGKTGVDIKSLRLETGLPKAINVALKTVVEARIKIQTAEHEGEAVRVRAEKAGLGAAAATQADLLAKAAGRGAMLGAEATGRAAIIAASDSPYGRFLAQLEALQTALANNSKVIITPDGANLLGMLAGATETLRQLAEADAKKLSAETPPAPAPKPAKGNTT